MIDRSHPIGKLANFRDLGSLQSASGKIRPGQVFRSDDLAHIDDLEAERLTDIGISLIIDLRSSDEVEIVGRGPLAASDIRYENVSLLSPELSGIQTEELLDREFTNHDLGLWYSKVFMDGLERIRTGLELVASAKGPVLFHCALGKDRTGIFAASLLAVLGADRKTIVQDYTRTNENIAKVLARLSVLQPYWSEELIVKSGALMRADQEAMEIMLDSIGSEQEIVENLNKAGLGASVQKELRERLAAP